MVDFVYAISPYVVPLFAVGVVAVVILGYLKFRKSTTKPIAREEVERKKFIERMELNPNQFDFKWLYRGSNLIGKILFSKGYKIAGNPHEHLIIDMVVQPCMFLRIPNPLAKLKPVKINYGTVSDGGGIDLLGKIDQDKLILPSWINFEYYFGIFYDNTLEQEQTWLIKNHQIALTDLHELAGEYFVLSQQLANMIPANAHEVTMKEKEIEHDIAKKRGEQQSI